MNSLSMFLKLKRKEYFGEIIKKRNYSSIPKNLVANERILFMQKVYTVGQINLYIKRMFQSDYVLRNLSIKGEVSNCKYHSSGHIYFSLKDDKGALSCIMFAGDRSRGLDFLLSDGQSVIVSGNLSVYERDGTYQIYAREIVLDGVGLLYEKFERLKQKLYEEGLFDHELKKEIPAYPKKVGIVTAPTGAAIQDMKSIAKRRNPYVQLYLYPAKVQGKNAAETIVKGIRTLDEMGMDTIIIGRGGGSIEDLWPFNEEIVARAIFAAKTPIISGTGHEIDTTIADYVADLRAATPSEACELAIPDYSLYAQSFLGARRKLDDLMWQKLDCARAKKEELSLRLRHLNPETALQEKKMRLFDIERRMGEAMKRKILFARHRIEVYYEKIEANSPAKKLAGGFGYIQTKEEKMISSVLKVEIGQEVKITVQDGSMEAKITKIRVKKGKDGISHGESEI